MSRLLLLLTVLLAACSTEFEPRAESDLHYSFWGYLDASADTQWVRVSPVRATSDPQAEPIDAEITLVDLGTGESTRFQDSLFTFETGFVARNAWTTAPVRLDAMYQMVARGPDGEETRATVRVPPDYPAPEIIDGPCNCPTRVIVRGAERVVDVITVYRDLGRGITESRSQLANIQPQPDGSVVVDIYSGDDSDALNLGAGGPYETSVVVAAGTDDWPDGLGLSAPEAAAALLATDGIENGVGFVGGAVTKRLAFVPGGGCPVQGSSPSPPCRRSRR